MPSPASSPSGGGAPIAFGALGGAAIGFAVGQATAGFLVGLSLGIAVAVLVWRRTRS